MSNPRWLTVIAMMTKRNRKLTTMKKNCKTIEDDNSDPESTRRPQKQHHQSSPTLDETDLFQMTPSPSEEPPSSVYYLSCDYIHLTLSFELVSLMCFLTFMIPCKSLSSSRFHIDVATPLDLTSTKILIRSSKHLQEGHPHLNLLHHLVLLIPLHKALRWWSFWWPRVANNMSNKSWKWWTHQWYRYRCHGHGSGNCNINQSHEDVHYQQRELRPQGPKVATLQANVLQPGELFVLYTCSDDDCFISVTIYLLFLSKCLLSYLIFGTYHYLILSLDPRLHGAFIRSSHHHTPPTCHILGYRVFALFIF